MRCSGPPRATPLLESLVGYSRAVRVGQWVSVAGTAAAERAAQRATRDDQVLLVAVVDGRVLGLAEVSLDPPPPAHQILLPVPSAHPHAVVAARARAKGSAADVSLPHASGLVLAAPSNSSPASRSTTRPRSTSTTAAATALTPQSDSGIDRRVRKSFVLRDGVGAAAGASCRVRGIARQRPDLLEGLLLVRPGMRVGAHERDLPDQEPPAAELGWLEAAPAELHGYLDRALGHRT